MMNNNMNSHLKQLEAVAKRMQEEALSNMRREISDIDKKIDDEVAAIYKDPRLSTEERDKAAKSLLEKKDKIKSISESTEQFMRSSDISGLQVNLDKLMNL